MIGNFFVPKFGSSSANDGYDIALPFPLLEFYALSNSTLANFQRAMS